VPNYQKVPQDLRLDLQLLQHQLPPVNNYDFSYLIVEPKAADLIANYTELLLPVKHLPSRKNDKSKLWVDPHKSFRRVLSQIHFDRGGSLKSYLMSGLINFA